MTDKKPKMGAAFAHAVMMGMASAAEFASGDSKANYSGHTLKRKGACLVCKDVGYSILMAVGDEVVSPWASVTVSTGDITPTALTHPTGSGPFGDAKPRIQRAVVGSLDFPIVTRDNLADGNHVINQNSISGKRLGAAVIMFSDASYKLCIANGSAITDKWYPMGGVVITPTAGSVRTPPVDKKPVLVQGTVAAIPFPVVTTAFLSEADSSVNSGDLLAFNGKQERAMVVEYKDDKSVVLRMAVGKAPTDKWVLLNNTLDTGAITPA